MADDSVGVIEVDGKWVPLDPRNVDFQKYLETSGRRHEDVVTEVRAAEQAKVKAADSEASKQRQLRKSGKDKLMAETWTPLTKAEVKALFSEAD